MIPPQTEDGDMFHFENVGLYDGLFVMQDAETETLWSHITGEAFYGEMAGHAMPVSNLLQLNVSVALEIHPDIEIALSEQPLESTVGRGMSPDNLSAELMGEFAVTLGQEDDRRERMEVGLGLWSDDARKYYPLASIRDAGSTIIDSFDGETVLIYIDPLSATPTAVYLDAEEARVDGREIVLDDGRRIRSGLLVDASDGTSPLAKPNQIFTRWYGYSLTFPGSEIYGE